MLVHPLDDPRQPEACGQLLWGIDWERCDAALR
jgi:hypothetical protein